LSKEGLKRIAAAKKADPPQNVDLCRRPGKTTMKTPQKLQLWIDARRRHHLSHAQIQMARELGMLPKSLDKLANGKPARWKLPLAAFIEERYRKRFKRSAPETVTSIEERLNAKGTENGASPDNISPQD
jgi:hypothetical protein